MVPGPVLDTLTRIAECAGGYTAYPAVGTFFNKARNETEDVTVVEVVYSKDVLPAMRELFRGLRSALHDAGEKAVLFTHREVESEYTEV